MRIHFTAVQHDGSAAAEAQAEAENREFEAGLWREVVVKYDEQGNEISREPAGIGAEDVKRHEAFIRCVLQGAPLVCAESGVLPPPRTEEQMQWDRIEAFARKGPETQAPGASKAVPANTQIAELDQKRAAKVVSRAQTRKLLIEAGFDLTKVRL